MITRAAILFALCGMTVLLCQFSPQPKGGDEAGVLTELPLVAGAFVGKSEDPSEQERAQLPTDTIIVKRSYRTPGRGVENTDLAQASLVIAGNDSRSIHRPEVCLDGQGWTVTNSCARITFTGLSGRMSARRRTWSASFSASATACCAT